MRFTGFRPYRWRRGASTGWWAFPTLGKVNASENTTLELEPRLAGLLSDGILKRPQVTVIIAEYGCQTAFVTAEVQRPGQHPLKSDRTLRALLGDVGARARAWGTR